MYNKKYISSFTDFNRLVVIGSTTESIDLDFKLELEIENISKKDKPKKAEELASDICQFANSFGGVLIIGIEERKDELSGKKVAASIPGIDNSEEISRFINDSVLPLIHPKNISIDLVCFNAKTNNHNQIVAINVLPIVVGVACVCSEAPPYSAKYPYRTHYGKRYLHPTEVEKRMADSYRIIPIKLEEIACSTRNVSLYPSLSKEPLDKVNRIDSKEDNIVLMEILKYEYKLNINGIDMNIPFSLTKDVWMTEKQTIGILLTTRLIISPDRKEIYFNL